MSADDRNDLPPPTAGSGDPEPDPERDAFGAGAGAPDAAPPAPLGSESEPKGAEHHPQFVGTGVFWGLVVGVILAIIVIVFAAQNTQSATIKVIAWDWSSPLFVVVLVSLIVGIVLDEIVGLLFRSRRRRRLAEKAELHRLRGKR